MNGKWCSTRNGSQLPPAPKTNSIAVDESLLSAITSREAKAVAPQIAYIYLTLLDMIQSDPENSRPVAGEWLFRFDGEGQDDVQESGWQQLRGMMDDVDEQEVRAAFGWMRERGIVDFYVEGDSFYVAVRNAIVPSSKKAE